MDPTKTHLPSRVFEDATGACGLDITCKSFSI